MVPNAAIAKLTVMSVHRRQLAWAAKIHLFCTWGTAKRNALKIWFRLKINALIARIILISVWSAMSLSVRNA